MLYLLLMLALGTVITLGVRAARMQLTRPKTRVIGPDDDPEFLWRLSHGDNNPH